MMRYRFIEDHRDRYSVDELCECFGLSRSGYYDWTVRGPSARSIEDKLLKEWIVRLHHLSAGPEWLVLFGHGDGSV